MIRIHNGGDTPKFKSTGYKIKEKDWNTKAKPDRKNWVKPTELRHKDINQKIEDMLVQLREELEGVGTTTLLKETRNTKKVVPGVT